MISDGKQEGGNWKSWGEGINMFQNLKKKNNC